MPFDRDKFDREFDRAWKRQSKVMIGLGIFGIAATIAGLIFAGWLVFAAIDYLSRH